jgi:hypothetical protein
MSHVTPIYRSIMLEIERRRHAVGFPMEKFSEYAGLPERYYAKALHPDTSSGRQAQWGTLQIIIEALFPHGFDVTITPKPGQIMTEESLKAKLLHLQAQKDPKSQRQLMVELASRATTDARKAGRKKIPRWRRRQIARQAGRASGRKRAELKRADVRGKNTTKLLQIREQRHEPA